MTTETTANTVFVTGAGFTRAFVPTAPLLVGDYHLSDLACRFAGFPVATAILHDAMGQDPKRIDLERLMTRVGGMPYDNDDARRELAVLEAELKRSLIRLLHAAQGAGVDTDSLNQFARLVLNTGASVVTFNYDDVLDHALWNVERVTSRINIPPRYWHPDGGYGFFCRPSIAASATAMPSWICHAVLC